MEQKKAYNAPEMKVVELKHQVNLLQDSDLPDRMKVIIIDP